MIAGGYHHTRGGAHRIQDVCPRRHHRLFAVGGQHGVEIGARSGRHQSAQDVGDPRLQVGVEHQFPPAELGDGGDGQVVGGGAQTTAGDDHVHALAGQERQLRMQVGGPVTALGEVREFDAELEEPVGQPGPVEVTDTAGQYLGSGHHDPGAHAHDVSLVSGPASS